MLEKNGLYCLEKKQQVMTADSFWLQLGLASLDLFFIYFINQK
jgi:hypothetical protein